MPIFEYICKKCNHNFETLVQGSSGVACPNCNSKRLEKQLSVFSASVKGSNTTSKSIPVSSCGTCGDPRGPGACSMN